MTWLRRIHCWLLCHHWRLTRIQPDLSRAGRRFGHFGWGIEQECKRCGAHETTLDPDYDLWGVPQDVSEEIDQS